MAAPLLEPACQLFDEFDSWFRQVLDNSQPDLIVAIARGAARLLELQSSDSSIPLVSQHAIPFLADSEVQDQRVLILDDSIIFGSTMAEVAGYVQKRGATVSNAAYVGDKAFRSPTNPNLGQLNPLVVGKELNENEVRAHHAALVHEIYQQGLDLNLDFPTLRVSIGDYSRLDIPFIAELLNQSRLLFGLRNVTHPVTGYNGVERWTANSDIRLNLRVLNERLVKRPNPKVRVTFVPSGYILFTPIVQLALHQSARFSDIQFSEPEFNSAWKDLAFSVPEEDQYYGSSLLRLVSFFEATIQCRYVAEHVQSILESDFGEFSYSFVERESNVVLGKKLSRDMVDLFDSVEASTLPHGSSNSRRSIEVCELSKSELADQLWEHLKRDELLALRETDACSTLLAKIFKGLRAITDSKKIRIACGDSSRLKKGLSFEDILYIIRRSEITITEEDLSFALDYCIDRALVVPKNLVRDEWVQRLFYCGEDGENDPDDQLRQNLHEAVSELGASIKTSKFDFHKICATTKHILDFVPLQTTPNNFGMTCVVGEKDLVSWVTPGENAPFLFEKNKKDNWVLVPNQDYKPTFSNTWNSHEVRSFFETTQNLYRLFDAISDEQKLLISTCGTIERCFDAVAYEIHSWAGKFNFMNPRKKTFGDGIHGAITDLKSHTDPIGQDAVERLYWSIVFSEECQKKMQVWRERRRIRQEIEKRIDRMNRPEIRRWWDSVFEELIATAADNDDYSRGLNAVADLADQIRTLTACAIRTLIRSGALVKEELYKLYSDEKLLSSKGKLDFYVKNSPKALVSEFNSLSRSLTTHWRARELPNLAIPTFPHTESGRRKWAIQVLDSVQNCRRAIASAIDDIAPELDTKTNAKRFSPGLDRELSANGRGLRVRTGVYVLTGIHKPTVEAPEQLKEFLRAAIDANDKLHIDIGSADRVFKAYSGYPADIADLSESIQEMNPGFGLLIQFGDIRSRMAINARVGTIELSSEMHQDANEMLGRLDTAFRDDPNLIACDEHASSNIEKHLSRNSEIVPYSNDSGSLFVLHTAGFKPFDGNEVSSRIEAMAESTSSSDGTKQSTFQRSGGYWKIIFDSQNLSIRDSAGMWYIHRLLAEPNREIQAVALLEERSGINSVAMSGSSGETLDSKALRNYEERAVELKQDIERARDDNDTVTLEVSEREFEEITNQISKAKGLRGRIREQNDAERIRKSVGNAVRRAIKSIQNESHSLGSHLDKSISKGITLKYAPEEPIDWLT